MIPNSIHPYNNIQLYNYAHLFFCTTAVLLSCGGKRIIGCQKKTQKHAECIKFEWQTKQFLIIKRAYVTKYEHRWCHEMIFPEHGDSMLSDALVPTCQTARRYTNPQQSSGLRLKLKTDDSKFHSKTFLDQFYAGIRSRIINRLRVCWNYIEKLISERKYWHINFISCLSWLLCFTSCALLIKFRICVQRPCSE
jgi:hypothetical protein